MPSPVANADSYSTHFNQTLTVAAGSGVLANDTDSPPGSTLSAIAVSLPTHGSLMSLSGDGAFAYRPSGSYVGTDTFSYKAYDGHSVSNTATVTISLTDTAAVAGNDSYALHGGAVTAAAPGVLANDTDADGDPLTAVLVSGPGHGAVALNGNGSFSYTPASGFSVSDSFTYKANDGGLDSNTATVTIYGPVLSWVGPTDTWSQSPVAPPTVTTPGNQSKAEGDSVSLSVSATDPHSYALSYDAVNLPPGLTINGGTGVISGTLSYQAAEDFGGSYPATVIVTNDHGASTSAAFTWAIADTPRAPVVTQPGDQTSAAGDTVSLQIGATQPDGDPLSYDAGGLPSGLTIDGDTGLISGTIDPSAGSNTAYSVTVTVTDNVPATPQTASKTFSWTVGAGTPSPTLTTPANQVNAAGDSVDLSLSASDGGGYPLTYIVSGLPAGLSAKPGTGKISGTIANAAVSATPYTVSVMASDGQASTTHTFSWAVGGVGLTNPGDQQGLDGASVSLPVTAWDAGSSTLSYSASGLPSGLSISSSTGTISGTIGSTAHSSTPYSVTVTATDGTNSTSATFAWAVARLALDNPGDRQALEGTSASLSLSVTDHVGTPGFSATGLPSGLSINSSTGAVTGTIGSTAHGQSPYHVTVTAADGSLTSVQSFTWSVTPQVTLANPGSQGNAAGDTVSLTVIATDRPSNTLTYSATGLPSGLSISSSSGVISGTIGSGAVSGSPHVVIVTASDGTYSSSQTFPWAVGTVFLAAPAGQSNLDDDVVSLALTASYHGSGSLTFSASGLPGGLSINSGTGVISGTLANTADAGGPYTVTVTATHASDSASRVFTWAVSPRVTVDTIAAQANVPGDTVSLTVTAGDAATGTPTWTYSASGLPGGLSINSSSGVISGALTASISGTPYAVTVTASDGTASASQTVNWSVVPVLLSKPGDQVSGGGATVSLALPAEVIAPYTSAGFSASGLPAGLSIGSITGVISGTLSSGDTGHSYLVTVVATEDGAMSSQEFTWRVGTVVVTAPADQTSAEGGSVSLAVSASAASGTLSYSAGGLPNGLSINASTGMISGTVGTTAAGADTVTVAASNGTVADSRTFTWTVNPRVVVNPVAGQSNLEGDSVSLQVTASEAGATLTYSATGLPSGLSINSTGLISGTVATGAHGSYTVDVTVTDGTYSTDVEFGWTVTHGSNTAPVLTNPGTQVNVVGDSVNLVLSASDADGDVLSYSAGGLPDGLNIDPDTGTISGTVAEDAVSKTPYSVAVTVDDGNGGTGTQTFSWIVNDSVLAVAGATITGTEGADTGTVTVATFTDTDPNWAAGAFTATIDWGDGSSDDGTIGGSDGSFTVTGDHVYKHPGTYTTQVSVTDGFATVTAAGSAAVSAAALTVSGGVMQGTVVGATVSGSWASFTDANPNEAASTYTATINWGDGSSTGTVTGFDGTFVVSGSHSYSAVGTYTVTVTVTDSDGTSGSATSTAQVGNIFAGVKATLTVATFTDTDPTATTGTFTATVDWGDGSALDYGATVTGSGGVFTVQGSHTYAVDSLDKTGGVYQVTVTITAAYSNTLTHTTPVHVERPPVAGSADNIIAQPGVAFSGVEVATFTEPDLSDSTSEFSATISWGDGTTSAGTVTGSGGVFHVLGSHTYATVGEFPVEVAISQAWDTVSTTLYLLGVAEVPAAVPPTIHGPRVVPGNSQYFFSVTLPAGVAPAALKKNEWSGDTPEVAKVDGGYRTTEDGWKTLYTLYAHVEFKNKPAEVTISLTYDIGAGPQTLKFDVIVVQVKVEAPKKPFEAGEPRDNATVNEKAVIDNDTEMNVLKQVASGNAGMAGAPGLLGRVW